MNRLERQIHRAMCELLTIGAVPNCFWFLREKGGWRSPTETKFFDSDGVCAAGLPTLILIYMGRIYALELRPKGARLTPEQKSCQGLMREAGAIVETAYGIEPAIEQLAAWGLLCSDMKVGRERSAILARSIHSLKLSSRAAAALVNAKILTIGELVARTDKELLTLPYFGRKSLFAIKEQVSKLGIALAPDVP